MLFSTQITSSTECAPRAVAALQAAQQVATYESRLKLRHPLGIYNISLSKVTSRFDEVIESFKKLPPLHQERKEIEDAKKNFLNALDALLDALVEHIDDCHNVIKCFFPSESDKQYKRVYSNFKKATRPYRDHVGKLVNKLKHEQGQLRLISFSWPSGYSYGYYVEGANHDGIIGPDEEIHLGGSTAFSLAHDFRFHLCGIYFLGTHLAQAVYECGHVQIKDRHVAGQDSPVLWKIIESVSAIKPVFFPDEFHKPIPTVKPNGKGALIAYGRIQHERVSTLPTAKIQVNIAGDGVSSTFRMPYFNG